MHIFQCISKIFVSCPLMLHKKRGTYTLTDMVSIYSLNFSGFSISEHVSETSQINCKLSTPPPPPPPKKKKKEKKEEKKEKRNEQRKKQIDKNKTKQNNNKITKKERCQKHVFVATSVALPRRLKTQHWHRSVPGHVSTATWASTLTLDVQQDFTNLVVYFEWRHPQRRYRIIEKTYVTSGPWYVINWHLEG